MLGVDVASFGLDATVFCLRQGMRVLEFQVYRNADHMTTASRVCKLIDERKVDAVAIDAGMGSGVIDRCRQLGYQVTEVPFSGAPRLARFANKRAEMFWDMSEWIRERGSLPHNPELVDELVAFSYTFKRDKLQLADKAEVKALLGGRSPDMADALALTFASPVSPRMTDWKQALRIEGKHLTSRDYDPYAPKDDPNSRESRIASGRSQGFIVDNWGRRVSLDEFK